MIDRRSRALSPSGSVTTAEHSSIGTPASRILETRSCGSCARTIEFSLMALRAEAEDYRCADCARASWSDPTA